VRPCFREILEYMEVKAEEMRDPHDKSFYVDLSASGVRRMHTTGLQRSSSLLPSSASASASSMPLPSLADSTGAASQQSKETEDYESARRTTTGSGEESGDGAVRLLIDQPASWDSSDDVDVGREQTRDEQRDRDQQRQRRRQLQLQRRREDEERRAGAGAEVEGEGEDVSEGGSGDEEHGDDEDSRTRRRLTINDSDSP
jgi:hypothetical protein